MAYTTYEQELTTQEKKSKYFDILIHHVVVKNTDPQSLLHKDTVTWLERNIDSKNADLYFEYACNHCMSAFVIYLWQHHAAKHADWKQNLQKCVFATNRTLIEFVYSILPNFVCDNANTFAAFALRQTNLSLWTFCLTLLSPREVFHCCKQSMGSRYLVFFQEAWQCVEHRHANELFDMALSLRNFEMARFLLKQPEFNRDELDKRLQMLVFMDMVDAVRMIPKLPKAVELEPCYVWCATSALTDRKAEMVRALYNIMPLDDAKWRELCVQYVLKAPAESVFLRTVFELGFITAEQFASIYKNNPFSQDLDIIHGDI